jgi:hypothetical protein
VSEGGHERLPHEGLRHGIGGTSNDSSEHICRSSMPSRAGEKLVAHLYWQRTGAGGGDMT